MTTRKVIGLAAVSLFALAPMVQAKEVKTKDAVISTADGLGGTTPPWVVPVVIGVVATGAILGMGGGGDGDGDSTPSTQ